MTLHALAPQASRHLPACERVLVAVGGGGSRAVLRWVADHLGAVPGAVSIVSVVTDDAAADEAERDAQSAAVVLGTMLEASQIAVAVRRGAVVEQLSLAVEEFAADLLVVGTHATVDRPRSGRITVAGRLAARSACAVVVVPDHWVPHAGPIVAGASVDSASVAALDVAHLLAERAGRRLMITHVWDLPTVGEVAIVPGGGESIPDRQRAALDAIVSEFYHHGSSVDVRADLRHGAVHPELVAAATGAAALVVGRRARSALAQSVLGSTSRALVSAPPCPVVVVPAPRPGIHVVPETLPEDL